MAKGLKKVAKKPSPKKKKASGEDYPTEEGSHFVDKVQHTGNWGLYRRNNHPLSGDGLPPTLEEEFKTEEEADAAYVLIYGE